MATEHYFGIDFGTTNSSVVQCVLHNGKSYTRHHGDDEGRPMPSLVAIDKEDPEKIYTGRDAWSKRTELSETCYCVPSVKSLLDEENPVFYIGDVQWEAKDIAAEVFRGLKAVTDDNNIESGEQLEAATVAIPVGTPASKRHVVREAAMTAGIAVSSFVSEPTAAFFANFNELKSCEHVAIFDWGGGTLDVSVLRNKDKRIVELSTVGMPVAGDNIDDMLARRIHSIVAKEKGLEHLRFEDMPLSAQDMLLVRAERAKRALGEDDDTVVSLNKYGEMGAFRHRISYEWFSEIVQGVVDKAIDCLVRAVEESGESFGTIDRIVMVGGSSSLGPLLDRMDDLYGDKLFFPLETVWSISEGAAKLSRHPGRYESAQDVGIILADGSYFPLLRRGEEVDGWCKTVDFGLVDTSNEVRVVFSGSVDIDGDSDRFHSVNVPSYRFLQEKIQLKAEVTADLVFRVSLKSAMKPKSAEQVWEYDRLKLSYAIPDFDL